MKNFITLPDYKEVLEVIKKVNKYDDKEFEVIRNRPSVTQGSCTVKYKDKEFTYADEIYFKDQNGDFINGFNLLKNEKHEFYGEVIGGWGSITPDKKFVEAAKYALCGYEPYYKEDIKEKLKEIIIIMTFAKEIIDMQLDVENLCLDTRNLNIGSKQKTDFIDNEEIACDNLYDVLKILKENIYAFLENHITENEVINPNDKYDIFKRFMSKIDLESTTYSYSIKDVLQTITPEDYDFLSEEKIKIFGEDEIPLNEIISILDNIENNQELPQEEDESEEL